MSRRRQERVTELIQQEVSKQLLLLQEPGLGFVTVVAVRLTPDFAQAKVYYSVLGSLEEQERTRLALERAKPLLRAHLRKLESLKFPPELHFVVDHSAEEAQKVFEVLAQIERERHQAPAPASSRRKKA